VLSHRGASTPCSRTEVLACSAPRAALACSAPVAVGPERLSNVRLACVGAGAPARSARCAVRRQDSSDARGFHDARPARAWAPADPTLCAVSLRGVRAAAAVHSFSLAVFFPTCPPASPFSCPGITCLGLPVGIVPTASPIPASLPTLWLHGPCPRGKVSASVGGLHKLRKMIGEPMGEHPGPRKMFCNQKALGGAAQGCETCLASP